MRYTQPQSGPVQIDRGNALSIGLIAAALPHLRVEAVNNGAPVQVGAFAASASKVGVGLLTNGSNNSLYFKIPQIVLTQWTIFGQLRSNSAGLDARAMNLGGLTSNAYIPLGTGNSNAGKVRVLASTDAGGLPANQESVAVCFDGTLHTIAMTYDGSNVRCYIDGVLDTTAGTSTGGIWTVDLINFGCLQRAGQAVFWPGSSFIGVAHKRALTGAEIASLSANPWQIFKSPQRIYTTTAAGGTTTYSYTASGGFVMSGTTTLARGVSKTPSGGMTLSGTVPAIRGVSKTTTGGLNIAGSAVSNRGAVRTTSGGISLSGTALTLRGRVLAGLGGLTFSGAASLVFTSAIQSLTVTPVGGLIIRGTATMVRSVVKAVSGGITFSGQSTTTLTPDPNPQTRRNFKRGRRPRTKT